MERHILIDGLNLAPGGGAVVMDRIAGALEARARVSVLLTRDIGPGPGARIQLAGPRGPAAVQAWRHLALPARARDLGADAILSFNLHSPARLPQATCHINLIPFLPWAERVRAVGAARALMLAHHARRALRLSDANLFESAHLRALAERAGPARGAATAPVGVDIPPPQAGPPVPHRLVCVTSGARHKRNGLALAAFDAYRRQRPAAELHLIGDRDAILSSLSEPDREAALRDPSVILTGRLDRPALHAALGRAWALLAVSGIESFHMVALEAMASGTPALGFEGASLRESVGPSMPLAAPGDMGGLTAALLSLDEVRPRLSAASRAWARGLSAGPCAARIARLVLAGTARAALAPGGAPAIP